MVKFRFCCEIYGYEIYGRLTRFMGVCEIYGRLYEIYGSLRDLWELRDLLGVQEACIQGQMIQNIKIHHMGKSWTPIATGVHG